MTDLEPNALAIVGCERDETLHLAFANSSTRRVTVLHSARCVAETQDLRHCSYSDALDKGISQNHWDEYLDRPVVAEISPNGNLVPFPIGTLLANQSLGQRDHAVRVQQQLNEGVVQ